MSSYVQLDESVRRTIAGWNLPAAVMRAVLQRLDDLAHQPSRLLIRVESPSHALQSDITARDPGPPVQDYLIVLSVRYRTDEQTLVVVECDRLVEGAPD